MSATASATPSPPQPGGSADGQLVAGSGLLARYANFVKLPHTLFALPFALVGIVLGSYRADVTVGTVAWVVVAFTAVRFAAMGFNRIADRAYDARNPRTAMREIPSGVMSVREASIAVGIAGLMFLGAAWMINPLCFALAPLALIWVLFYSYTKRFTRWSHLVLGLGLGIAPVGGYLAVTGAWGEPWWLLVVLATAVMSWTAGFDIIYAMQDVEIDRTEGLHSVPSRMGATGAFFVSRALHVVTIGSLAAVGGVMSGGLYYFIGLAIAGGLLVYEQYLASIGRVQKAFFTVNMVLSTIFFVFVLLDRVLPYQPVVSP